MADIRGVRLRKFKLRKIILGVRMHFRHRYQSVFLRMFMYVSPAYGRTKYNTIFGRTVMMLSRGLVTIGLTGCIG